MVYKSYQFSKPEIFLTKIPHYLLILGRTSESLLESSASNNSSRFFFFLGTSSSVTLSESMDSFPFDFLAAFFFFFGEITTSVKKFFFFFLSFLNSVNSKTLITHKVLLNSVQNYLLAHFKDLSHCCLEHLPRHSFLLPFPSATPF